MDRWETDRAKLLRGIAVGLLVILPWTWFLIRDRFSLMEGIAVGLPLLVLGGLLVAGVVGVILRTWLAIPIAFSVVVFGVVVIVAPRTPQAGPAPEFPVRVVAANVLEGNPHPQNAAAALVEQGAGVLAVVEGADAVRAELDAAYPHVVVRGTLTVHSRYAIRQLASGARLSGYRVLRARVWGPGGPFVLYAVHSLNPLYQASFSQQLSFLDALISRVGLERQPTVLLGDFNLTDRGQGYRRITLSLRDAMRASWAESTYEDGIWALLFLRIDHIFTSPRWCARDSLRFAIPGSDHAGVASSVGPCPGAEPTEPTALPSI
jgi:endonuclease/exonuclease/phosphatase (EEP) superfamily protein YafD